MAVHRVPRDQQPEFDALAPLTPADRLLLRLIRPLLTLWQLVAAPPRLHRVHRAPRGYRGRDATADEWIAMPELSREFFDNSERALHALGFGAPRHTISPSLSRGVVYASTMFAPATQELAHLYAGVVPRRLTTTTVSFEVWWDDGTRLITSNTQNEQLFAESRRSPTIDALSLPGLENIDRLYSIHRARRVNARGKTPIGHGWDDADDNPIALLRRAAEQWEQHVVATGMYKTENDALLRLTWKGAIILAWSRIEPFRSYLAKKGRRRTERVLRQ